MIRVVIAEDHSLVRDGIRKLLEEQEDIEVVGEASNGLQAVEEVKSKQPAVVVLDFKMPELNGLEAAEQIRTNGIPVNIVLLSMYADELILKEALAKNVNGYVLKQSVSGDLISAIRAAADGNLYVSSDVAQLLMSTVTSPQAENPLDTLSPREREVIEMVVKGYTSRQIAEHFSKSVKTVERQRRSAMEKLDVNDVATLVRLCIKLGMVIDDEFDVERSTQSFSKI